jgi:hypothetical protein
MAKKKSKPKPPAKPVAAPVAVTKKPDTTLSNASSIETDLFGASYPYYKNIKAPNQIGMSSKGTLPQLAKDINGLISYVEVLVTGKSKASVTGNPLGNKYFLKTGTKCKDPNANMVDRYIYINNVPQGNIPIISSGMDRNFKEFKGLIPGAISNLNALNPMRLWDAFSMGAVPDCQQITMETIDIRNNKSRETQYVTLADIRNIDSCSFPNKTNPLTRAKCKETFSTLNTTNMDDYSAVQIPDDPIAQIYFLGLSSLGIYILYQMMNK